MAAPGVAPHGSRLTSVIRLAAPPGLAKQSIIEPVPGLRATVELIPDYGNCPTTYRGYRWYVSWGDGVSSVKNVSALTPQQAQYTCEFFCADSLVTCPAVLFDERLSRAPRPVLRRCLAFVMSHLCIASGIAAILTPSADVKGGSYNVTISFCSYPFYCCESCSSLWQVITIA